MQLATLGAVALIHEDEQFAHCRAGLGLELFRISLEIIDPTHAELVHQGTEQPGCGLVQDLHQLSATAAALDGFTPSTEHSFDLLEDSMLQACSSLQPSGGDNTTHRPAFVEPSRRMRPSWRNLRRLYSTPLSERLSRRASSAMVTCGLARS